MKQQITFLRKGENGYPSKLTEYLGEHAPAKITLRGNQDLWLDHRKQWLGFFCSEKAPASIILQTHDLAQQWCKTEKMVISGFHSPVEQECLTVLLRGSQPLIICPAREILKMRLPREYKDAMRSGRLLLMSPFEEKKRRKTAETAMIRNRFVAAIADDVLIAHAQPDGKTEQLARELIARGKQIYTLNNSANGNLLALGAKPPATVSSHTADHPKRRRVIS